VRGFFLRASIGCVGLALEQLARRRRRHNRRGSCSVRWPRPRLKMVIPSHSALAYPCP